MKIIITTLLCLFTCLVNAQTQESIVLLDVVKVQPDKRAEAAYYFEKNWKLFREEALKRRVIKSYRALEVIKDSGQIEFVLMTEFKDSIQFKRVEENFRPIMEQLRPNGPVFLNNSRPDEFREMIYSHRAKVLFEP